MKICTKCKETKELSEFGKKPGGKGGLASGCRACTKAYMKVYHQANKERRKTSNDAYYQANKEQVRANKKASYQANKEQINNRNNAWYQTNKEQVKASVKAWYQANKERVKANNKAWKETNKELVINNKKAWRKANPDKCNAYYAKYRAAKLQRTPSWLTSEDWNKISAFYTEAQNLTKQTGIKHEVDHIIPLQGCTVSGLHTPNNLQILTKSENSSKGNTF